MKETFSPKYAEVVQRQGLFPESLICSETLNVKLYHMIRISVIVFLAVQIISAESSLDCVFSRKYIFISV